MAGHIAVDFFSKSKDYNVSSLQENDIIDVKNNIIADINIIKKSAPDIVVNCIRWLVQESQQNTLKAILYNSYLPKFLEKSFRNKHTKIIHLSSDCIFSGNKGNYSEESDADGSSNYALTKFLGEINNEKDLTIRTSYIGPNINESSEELFHWFMMQNNLVNGYSKVFWTGITTLELSKSIDVLIKNNVSGIYHVVPKYKISKYDLLVLIKNIWKKNDVTIVPDSRISNDRSLIDTRNIIHVNNYEIIFHQLYDYMIENKKRYKQYFE
jgi:dTDP-4-dehydrorhamnose reductase